MEPWRSVSSSAVKEALYIHTGCGGRILMCANCRGGNITEAGVIYVTDSDAPGITDQVVIRKCSNCGAPWHGAYKHRLTEGRLTQPLPSQIRPTCGY